MSTDTNLRETVRQRYAQAAATAECCEPSCCSGTTAQAVDIKGGSYEAAELSDLPRGAATASLGCGNPTAVADLAQGEKVLDLGSGGGIDVLLAARRVGPDGFVYGLDMTDEMLALAESNRQKAGAENVKFLRGHIEDIPLPDASVDVIISNCVINLSGDKDRVFREAFRVLKPGGRFAVSDVVTEGDLPEAVRRDMESYVGCVAGALDKEDYLARLAAAGFVDASIEATRRYTFSDLGESCCSSQAVDALSPEERERLDGRVQSGFIRATKPV